MIRERFFRYTDYVSRFSLEETMEFEKIIALDNKFTALLNDEELMMLEYISYHNLGAAEPLNLNHSFYSAYPKWLSVFFNKSEPVFGKINPVLLGKQIEYLRFCSEIMKSTLASMIGVDRTTIKDIEKGKRIPSFETIYRILVIFKISIDKIVKNSIVGNIFDIRIKEESKHLNG